MELLLNIISNALEIMFYLLYFTFLGCLFNKILNDKNEIRLKDIIELNVSGFFIHLLYITVVNIFHPINSWLLIIPSFGILFSWKQILTLFFIIKRKIATENLIVITILFTPMLFWISNLSLGLLKYESAYYIQKIRWAQQFPLVPGLANLDS